ncbi:MAG: P-loop NTPase fold protein [Acidimicrobiaceae bacterium]|nr:P-loop NTPase fold protein [Acidimicrobiaceae bacterium]
MLVRARDFEATVENPFADDRLGREEHVKAVCRAIAEMDGPAVVALDGGWGTGKTAFLAMCTAWLQSEFEIPIVRFNAWSQSHTQMPLVDLVSALTAEGKPAARPLKKVVAAVGWHVAKFGTRGLVDRDVIAEATVSEDSWDNAEKETAKFKKQLQDWAEASGPQGLVVCVLTNLTDVAPSTPCPC